MSHTILISWICQDVDVLAVVNVVPSGPIMESKIPCTLSTSNVKGDHMKGIYFGRFKIPNRSLNETVLLDFEYETAT